MPDTSEILDMLGGAIIKLPRIEYGIGGLVSTCQQSISWGHGSNMLPGFLPYWGLVHSVVNTLRGGLVNYLKADSDHEYFRRFIVRGFVDLASNIQLGYMSYRDLAGESPVFIGHSSGISNTVIGFAINSAVELMWAIRYYRKLDQDNDNDEKISDFSNNLTIKAINFLAWTGLVLAQAMGYGAAVNIAAFAALAVVSTYYLYDNISTMAFDKRENGSYTRLGM